MSRRGVFLLPKQSAEELQEQRRQDAEEEFNHASNIALRNASQTFVDNGVMQNGIMPVNHLGHGQQMFVDPTLYSQMRHNQQMQQIQATQQMMNQQPMQNPQHMQQVHQMPQDDFTAEQDQPNWIGVSKLHDMFEQQHQQQHPYQQQQLADNSHDLGLFTLDGGTPSIPGKSNVACISSSTILIDTPKPRRTNLTSLCRP